MEIVRKGIVLLLVLTAAFFGMLLATGHQLGSRPASSLAPLSQKPDVQFVTANGIRFGYLEMGEGPLVLMFHGYPETARSWNAVQIEMAAAGYRTIAIFMRGYPPTGFADEYSVRSLGADAIALISALGEESAHLVGHDWGASAVYQAAYASPDKVNKLVAISIPHPIAIAGDPSVLLQAPHFIYYQSPWSVRQLWSHDFAHIDYIYETWSPDYEVPASELADIKASLRVPGAVQGALGYYWSFVSEGADKTGPPPTSQIEVPSLIIVGDADHAVNPDRFDRAASAFVAGYQLTRLPGVGHFPQLEDPGGVSTAIVAFLNADEFPEANR